MRQVGLFPVDTFAGPPRLRFGQNFPACDYPLYRNGPQVCPDCFPIANDQREGKIAVCQNRGNSRVAHFAKSKYGLRL